MKRKRTFFCIWTYWMTFLLAVLPSCIYDEEPAATDADIVPLHMGITIRVPGTDPSARGANHDKENEEGTALENAIDVKNGDIRIYLYKNGKDANDKANFNTSTYLGEVSIFDTQENKQGDYTLLGRINATSDNISEMNTNGFRIVVMANLAKWYKSESAADYGYPTLTESLTSFQESYSLFYGDGNKAYNDYGYCVGENKLIPMWGIHTYKSNEVQLKPDEMFLLEAPIDMLRAFAKIEVIDATTDSDLQLTEVSLKGHSTQFYIQPHESGYTEGNTDANFTDCNIPGNSSDTQTALKFTEDKDTSTDGTDTKKKFVLYVPEYTTTGSSIPMILTVKFGNDVEKDIYLSEEPSKISTLLRNHIYRFNVSLKKGELSIFYQGIPWEKKDEISIESGCDYNYNQSANN